MPRTFPGGPEWHDLDMFERVESVPDNIAWKPRDGAKAKKYVSLSSIGDYYRIVRVLETGAVHCFKRKTDDALTISKDKIDAEPEQRKQIRYRKGAQAWWVEHGLWFLVAIVDRTPNRVTISSVTGWDAERKSEWAYGALLEFPPGGTMFKHLRPLKDRKP